MHYFPLLSRWSLSVLLLCCCIGCQAQQEPASSFTKIGSHGAGFEVDSSWERRELTADVGDDQFILAKKTSCFLVVLEEHGLLETEEDFRNKFAEITVGLLAKPQPIAKMKFSKNGNVLHAFQSFDADIKGIKLSYHIHILSRAGLTYQFLCWAPRSNAQFLKKEADLVVAGFRFPDAESDWASSTIPKTHRFQTGAHELSFAVRPSVFIRKKEEGYLAQFLDPIENNAIYVQETTGYSLGDVLDSALRAINEGEEDPFVERRRSNQKIGEQDGRMLVCTDSTLTLHLLAIKLQRNKYLDIRYMTTGDSNDARFDRDLFLETLSLSTFDSGLDLPDLEQASKPNPLNPHETAVYKRAKLVARTALGYVQSCYRSPEGRFVVAGSREVVLAAGAEEDSTDELVYRTDQWKSNLHAVQWQRRWLVTGEDHNLLYVDKQVSKPAKIRGKHFAVSKNRLFVVSPPPEVSLLGMSFDPETGPEVLLEYDPTLVGRPIASFATQRVQRLAVDDRATHALVLLANIQDLTSDIESLSQLMKIDLQSGRKTPLGNWDQISQICSAGDAWLVTGQPNKLPHGIYRVSASGDSEVLMTGTNLFGVALLENQLLFASPQSLQPMGGAGYYFYKIALDDLLPHGPLCNPFGEIELNRIANEWLSRQAEGELPTPRTEEEIRQLVELASKISKELVGRQLPATEAEIDTLCNSFSANDQLNRPGRMLVTLLVTVGLLDQGATWVESDQATAMDWLVPEAILADSSFVMGYTPSSIVSSVLDNSEGYWSAVETIRTSAEGRPVLLGLKRSAVQEAMRKEAPKGDVQQIVREGSAAEVIALLDSTPENEYLRSVVYRHLAPEPRQAVMLEVTRRMAARKDATLADHLAWSILRCARLKSADEAQLLVDDLHKLLRQHPNEAALYLLLGKAYERATPETPQSSKACYRRVLEISSWGKVGEDATQLLEAIESATSG